MALLFNIFRGVDFDSMSSVLNGWLNSTESSTKVKACELWDVEELQQFQGLLYILRESQFDQIYQNTGDNRRMREHVLKVYE